MSSNLGYLYIAASFLHTVVHCLDLGEIVRTIINVHRTCITSRLALKDTTPVLTAPENVCNPEITKFRYYCGSEWYKVFFISDCSIVFIVFII